MNCSLPGSFRLWDIPGKGTGMSCHFFLQGNLPKPGIKPWSLALQADSLLSELPGNFHDKPRQHIKKQRHHFADKGLYSRLWFFQ